MVGYLHTGDGSSLKSSSEAVDCTARTPVSAPNANGAPGGVRSVVCSPDLAVFPTQPQPRSYQCELCRKTFSQKNTYQNHMRSHAIGSPAAAASSSASSLSPPAAAPSNTPVVNGEVGPSTSASNGTGEDPYPCTICGKTFAVPARLTRHFRTHTGEKPYTCEYCHKSFSVKENLSVHRRIHTKERPYKCDVCARAFEHSGKLHRHMRIHTGERPHRCGVCGKTFIQSGQLVIHTRTHTGEKPYVCPVCHKGFTCSKQLKVHSRTHTGEKPYACEICGKAFGYNHVLKLHQVAHYGEKVYKCTLCHTTFTNKKTMEAHIKTHSSAPQSQPSQQPPNSSPPQELSDKGTKDLAAASSSSSRYLYEYEPPAPPAPSSTINPALLAAVAAVSHEDEDSRSSSATPPLRMVEDGPPLVLEPAVRLCPDPLASLTRHSTSDYSQRESSPEYMRGSPPAPSAQFVVVDSPPPRKCGHKSVSLTTPSAHVGRPETSPSPELAEQGTTNGSHDSTNRANDPASGATKRSRIILQRYLQESTPALRSSSVIRFALRSQE